ncbi:hypothetical protein VUJ46_01545 [Chryseobacterium sp. MYb264]|uniref:hypothetical protein n=1 Tax=Chryseobacterium sp. MYb264 TaxID=2745153 RepID=UPI002E0EB44C|nr:hypothetical protein VUJ46_01545 [Chryseobacterium sp. MYb264]
MKKSLVALLLNIVIFGFAQKKKSTPKINSNTTNVSSSIPTTKEDDYLPVKFLQTFPTKPIDAKLLADLRSRNFDLTVNEQIPMDENNTGFQYDYLINYRNKKKILISPDGKEEEFPDNINLIDVFKDGSKIISDKCIEKSEVSHCQNVRILSKDGAMKPIPFEYSYLVNMGVNHKNLNEKSFTILFNNATSNKNIIDEKGTILLANDAININLLFPPYASIEISSGVSKIFNLLDKKFVDFENLKFDKDLPTHKLFVMTRASDRKYILLDPVTKKILFEAEGNIMEIGEKEVAKDFFMVLKDENKKIINRKGEVVFGDNVSNVRLMENGNILATDNGFKQNIYDILQKKYLYPQFYKEMGKIGNFSYVKFDKFFEISNFSNGEIVYTEKDRVDQYGNLGNLIYFNRTVEGGSMAGVYDIYNKDNILIVKDKKGFNRMSDGNDNYFTVRNINDYSIIDRDGKILISNMNIPNYIRYNNSKNMFELTKKREGSAYECYNLTGNKVDCK